MSTTGYVTDIEYPHYFFREQSPAFLNFACLVNGVEPIAIDRPFNYFELGSGQCATVTINAAANPQGRFYAADFMPAHIAAARDMAETAQLDNLTLLENSFAELAGGKVDLPQFDFVTMYGVYSWVNAENRAHIVDFLARYLKPGGIVYVNYNAMPGWSSALPLQRLMLQHVDLYPSGKDEQVAQMRGLVQHMIGAQAGYFANADGMLKAEIDSVANGDIRYLAHEFMNKGWDALYHADVVRDFAAARLDYAGSASLPQCFPHLCLASAQRDLLDRVREPVLRETVRDYIRNTKFREDIFVRGARCMAPARRDQWLARIGLASIVIRGAANPCLTTPLGDTACDAHLYVAMMEALADSPRTLAELAVLPELNGAGIEKLLEVAAMLVASEQASPYSVHALADKGAAAMRLNLAIADHACIDDTRQALASPLLGNGVQSGLIQRLVFRRLARQSGELDVDALIAEVAGLLEEHAFPLERDGARLVKQEEIRAEIERIVRAILEHRAPVWHQLKMLG